MLLLGLSLSHASAALRGQDDLAGGRVLAAEDAGALAALPAAAEAVFPTCADDINSNGVALDARSYAQLSDFILGNRPLFYDSTVPSCVADIGSEINVFGAQGNPTTAIFITHGLTGKPTDRWMHSIKDAVIAKNDPNTAVYIASWKKGAEACKLTRTFLVGCAAPNIFPNGVVIGRKMAALWRANNNIKITCVGHSLGAHSCGMAGKVFTAITGRKIAKIIGLDAAGPLFDDVLRANPITNARSDKMENWRITANDADFVQVGTLN